MKYFCSGIKLSDASKKLGKKFATGASVVKVHQMPLMTIQFLSFLFH
jgi:translation initiation factor 1 (eIF-1/SUI1)